MYSYLEAAIEDIHVHTIVHPNIQTHSTHIHPTTRTPLPTPLIYHHPHKQSIYVPRVTVNMQELELPASSVAVHVTVVTPAVKVDPEAGEHVT